MDQAIRGGVIGRAVFLAVGLGLAGCSSGVGDLNPGALVSGGRDIAKEQETLRRFAAVQVCPEIQIREGTQVFQRYQNGKQGVPEALDFQGTITKFARECAVAQDGGTLIKVGVGGRVINGPTGATGQVNVPLRVVLVKNGSEVLYSQLLTIPVAVEPGQGSAIWNTVVDGLVVPYQTDNSSFLIYVGFDESGARS